jgi:hypothetical protein
MGSGSTSDSTGRRRATPASGAVGVIPGPLWLVLGLIAVVIVGFTMFFTDSGERAMVRAAEIGTVVIVINLDSAGSPATTLRCPATSAGSPGCRQARRGRATRSSGLVELRRCRRCRAAGATPSRGRGGSRIGDGFTVSTGLELVVCVLVDDQRVDHASRLPRSEIAARCAV